MKVNILNLTMLLVSLFLVANSHASSSDDFRVATYRKLTQTNNACFIELSEIFDKSLGYRIPDFTVTCGNEIARMSTNNRSNDYLLAQALDIFIGEGFTIKTSNKEMNKFLVVKETQRK